MTRCVDSNGQDHCSIFGRCGGSSSNEAESCRVNRNGQAGNSRRLPGLTPYHYLTSTTVPDLLRFLNSSAP